MAAMLLQPFGCELTPVVVSRKCYQSSTLKWVALSPGALFTQCSAHLNTHTDTEKKRGENSTQRKTQRNKTWAFRKVWVLRCTWGSLERVNKKKTALNNFPPGVGISPGMLHVELLFIPFFQYRTTALMRSKISHMVKRFKCKHETWTRVGFLLRLGALMWFEVMFYTHTHH